MIKAVYKINGYDWRDDLGVLPSGDRTTADSFEKPAGTLETEKYQWAEGILEYDLDSPVYLKPRVFIIKGTMVLATLLDYQAAKVTLTEFLYQNYVTLEAVHLGVKANARLQPDGVEWHRITHLDNGKIAVQVQFTFDEIQQDVPFKDDSANPLTFMIDNEGNFITTPQGEYITVKDN